MQIEMPENASLHSMLANEHQKQAKNQMKVGRRVPSQTGTKDHTGSVALREALESAVQLERGLERGDEVNRQAEMANPTKYRDSLQACCVVPMRASGIIVSQIILLGMLL
jgi:hypothetical protein